MTMLDKEVIYVPRNETSGDFIILLGMVSNLKLINCLFPEFPFNIFRLQVTETTERKTKGKEGLLEFSFKSEF